MRRFWGMFFVLVWAAVPAVGWAKVDLVTLPERERVQLTIYNSADLTLVRDVRSLTLRKGLNRLQFSWVQTLVDPTSLELAPVHGSREVDVQDLDYPPRAAGLGIWNVDSRGAGSVPMEISYFTSGISWSAYYLAILSPDETSMRLKGYVRVQNGSGEDYRNAETRLVVGKINLVDRIAELARRRWPYGRPGPEVSPAPASRLEGGAPRVMLQEAKGALAAAPKEIRKEGLSEYFLYSIEGTEDIPDGWGKRLVSFEAERIPVRNLYRYEEERYGSRTMRFLEFANDEAHHLGREPIPGGLVKVFRSLPGDGHLSYVGARQTKYVPKGEEVTLDLGTARDVVVTAAVMEVSTDNFEWREDNHRTALTGWDEHSTVQVKVANHRDTAVKVEIRRNFPGRSWELVNEGETGTYRKVDADTVEYVLELPAHGRSSFRYRLVVHQGTRAM